jgi:NAD(P)H dehydrogenase (quinone)
VIVVTGATGHVGGLLARELAVRGEPMRLLVRDPVRAPELPGAEVVRGDYGDPDSLAEALKEGDRVFMVSMHAGPAERLPLHKSFVDAAAHAGVEQVVYLSFLNAGPETAFIHGKAHGATEQMLEDAGLRWTAMRNSMYADHIPGWFDPDGVARETVGDARMSFSYRPELAKAIAVTLTEPGHDGIYNVTTPESVSFTELAELASEVTGKPYRYEPVPHEEWDERWRAMGREGWELESGHTSYEAIRNGEYDLVTDDYKRLTGEEPLAIRELLERHAHDLPLS